MITTVHKGVRWMFKEESNEWVPMSLADVMREEQEGGEEVGKYTSKNYIPMPDPSSPRYNEKREYNSPPDKRSFVVPPPKIVEQRWLNGTFVCTCEKPDAVKYLCNHLVQLYKTCDDALEGMIRRPKTGEGKAVVKVPFSGLKVPLAGGLQLECTAKYEKHWSEDETMDGVVKVSSPSFPLLDGIYFTTYDGLIRVIGYFCDALRSTSYYTDCLNRLLVRRSIMCMSSKHTDKDNLALVTRIKVMANHRLGTSVAVIAISNWDVDVLRPVLEEIALEESFSMMRHELCFTCENKKIDPNNIPDDLVPVF